MYVCIALVERNSTLQIRCSYVQIKIYVSCNLLAIFVWKMNKNIYLTCNQKKSQKQSGRCVLLSVYALYICLPDILLWHVGHLHLKIYVRSQMFNAISFSLFFCTLAWILTNLCHIILLRIMHGMMHMERRLFNDVYGEKETFQAQFWRRVHENSDFT